MILVGALAMIYERAGHWACQRGPHQTRARTLRIRDDVVTIAGTDHMAAIKRERGRFVSAIRSPRRSRPRRAGIKRERGRFVSAISHSSLWIGGHQTRARTLRIRDPLCGPINAPPRDFE